MKLPAWLYDEYAEKGIIWGLIASYVMLALIGESDTSLALDYKNNNVPYGILWTWLNPFWYTQQPYMMLVSLVQLPFFLWQYHLYRKGRISKKMIMLGLFSNVFFAAQHVWQENTVTMFGPLVSVYPWMVVFMILQKLPLGWSWGITDNAHWECGINGQCVDFYNSRLDIIRSDFITHIVLVFWMVMPLLVWYHRKTGKMPFGRVFQWIERHKLIAFLAFVAFFTFLTAYAWINNGGFLNWRYGDGA